MITRWHETERKGYLEGELASQLFEYVRGLETSQDCIYERLFRLACLYDPYTSRLYGYGEGDGHKRGQVVENVIASNVDTVTADIATTKIRPRFLTDDGDWQTKRKASHLSWYAEGLAKHLNVHKLKVQAVKWSSLKGTAFAHVWPSKYLGKVCAEPILVDDVVVDDSKCRGDKGPLEIHFWKFPDRFELAAEFPQHDERIKSVELSDTGASWRNRPEHNNDTVAELWTYRLPVGKKGSKGYTPGRHVRCIDGVELLDVTYEQDYFPVARMAWSEREGYYGIGGGERIAGHQRRLTKMHWQVDRQLDQHAMPTTWVHQGDASIAVKTRNAFGTLGAYKVAIPKTVIPAAVSGETYARLDRIAESSFEEFGTSRMAATSRKPAGLDSGRALMEYKDQTSGRFGVQDQAAEDFELECIWLGVMACKKLAEWEGCEPPVIVKKLAKGRRRLKWADVDPLETKLQMQAAASLSRTSAGRTQSILEYAQAGIFTTDEVRRLLGPHDSLDVKAAISAYDAALRYSEMQIAEMLDGVPVMPNPRQNLDIGLRYVQSAALEAESDGAPDDVLQLLENWATLAADMLAPPDAMPGPEMGAPAPMAPDAQGAPPTTALAADLMNG